MEILNARIERTFLGREDHGILTFTLGLNTDRYMCQYGGFALDRETHDGAHEYYAAGLEAIAKLIEAIGARSWEDLRGMLVRIAVSDRSVVKIGHILHDTWVDLREVFKNGEE